MSSALTGLSGKRQKVLVYLFGSLGDSIVAIPALRAVRHHFPDSEIVLLQNFESKGIVLASEVIPPRLVDRYLSYSSRSDRRSRLEEFFRLWRQLRVERFDAAVYLVISERPAKAVTRDRFFFRSAGIRELIGFHAVPTDEL
jgi:ADP-heptose:LPS heptosyltransferase